MSTRKYLIAGNWKMNKSIDEATVLVDELKEAIGSVTEVDSCVCPPFLSAVFAVEVLKECNIAVGVQNLYPKDSGAYTGEVSAPMIADAGCEYVILGHSERREYFGESDAFINEKTKAALACDLKPIVCIGETLEERESGDTMKVVETQLKGSLLDLTAKDAETLVIAYEPVWAIGTGKTATPEMAQEVHAGIRKLLVDQFAEAGNGIRILYGGSMKPGNASDLLDQADIDGGLIGGASLKSEDFSELVNIAKSKV